MKVKVFTKDTDIEDLIYLDNKFIGDFPKMINIIINNLDTDYKFINFNKQELKFIKLILKNYKLKEKEKYTKSNLTVVTHKLTQKVKRIYNLDKFNYNKDKLIFESIDKLEFKKVNNRDIVIIEGIISVRGLKNNYGFYNIEEDLFIPIDELEENKNLLIESLSGPNKLHYVKKRVR